MQTTFYVSHAGQNYGPWTVEEITKRIAQMELIATDYIFDDAKNGWIPLLECEAVLTALKSQKPAAPPSGKPTAPVAETKPQTKAAEAPAVASTSLVTDASAEDAEWFVQKDTHRYGPFTYFGLIKALQDKSIFDYDLLWRKGMDEWVRIAEHEMFKADVIRSVKAKHAAEAAKFFAMRKHPRFEMKSEVIVHDNKQVWLGEMFQGSEGGSGVLIQNAMLVPGQVLLLHFTGSDGLPPFNALCEVVNKRYVPSVKDQRSAVPYGVKFVKIEKKIQDTLKEYYASKAA